MEEERLIPPQERKPQSKPKSSPSARNTSPQIVHRPAMASSTSVSGASNLHSIRGQNGGATLVARDEKQTIKEKSYESRRKSEAFVHDGLSTSKVDEGWTEGNMEGDDAITGMTEFSSSFTYVNEQTPYESPPKYCRRHAIHEPLL